MSLEIPEDHLCLKENAVLFVNEQVKKHFRCTPITSLVVCTLRYRDGGIIPIINDLEWQGEVWKEEMIVNAWKRSLNSDMRLWGDSYNASDWSRAKHRFSSKLDISLSGSNRFLLSLGLYKQDEPIIEYAFNFREELTRKVHKIINASAEYFTNEKADFIHIPIEKKIQSRYREPVLGLPSLSKTQEEVLIFIAKGYCPKEIATSRKCSVSTVNKHIEQLRLKLDCRTYNKLIRAAISMGYGSFEVE